MNTFVPLIVTSLIVIGLENCGSLGASVQRKSTPSSPPSAAPPSKNTDPKGSDAEYLLLNVGLGYEEHRKPKWMMVYKNSEKKECLFREIDSSTADTLTTAYNNKDKPKKISLPGHLSKLLVINDSNVSSVCDGYSTKYI